MAQSVQEIRTDINGATGGTSAALTTAASGSTFLILVSCDQALTITVNNDSKGNAYTAAGAAVSISGADQIRAYYTTSATPTGGSGHTASISLSGNGFGSFYFYEITNSVSGAVDAYNTATYTANSSPYPVTSGTPAQANYAVVSICGTTGGGTNTYSATGYTVDSQGDGATYWPSASGYKVVTGGGSAETCSWAVTGTSQAIDIILLVKAAAAAAASVQAPDLAVVGTRPLGTKTGSKGLIAKFMAMGPMPASPAIAAAPATGGVGQTASQAEGTSIWVVNAIAQTASQAAGSSTVAAGGVGQTASQASGAVIEAVLGVGQTASQASGSVVEVVAGASQEPSQASGAVVDVTAGVGQAPSQAASSSTVVGGGQGQSESQAAGSVVVVAQGVAQSWAQTEGPAPSGNVVKAGGEAQATSQAAGSVVEAVAGAGQTASQASGSVSVVVGGAAQAPSQSEGAAIAQVTIVASGVASSYGQAASNGGVVSLSTKLGGDDAPPKKKKRIPLGLQELPEPITYAHIEAVQKSKKNPRVVVDEDEEEILMLLS